jgi:cysteine-rich repeat protein
MPETITMLLLSKIPALHAVATRRVLWLVAVLRSPCLGSSCFDSATAACSDGRRCPVGTRCSAAGNRCIGGFNCGNGVLDKGEVCDDDNAISADGCSADCASTEECGTESSSVFLNREREERLDRSDEVIRISIVPGLAPASTGISLTDRSERRMQT